MASHEFALYCDHQFSSAITRADNRIIITDRDLIHRIGNVLRLAPLDTIFLFNDHEHVQGVIETIDKKHIAIHIKNHGKNIHHQPPITVQLALIKRDALQEAVSNLTCLGVHTIELFISDRTQRAWDGAREHERLHRCMIAAAEQSKNFAIPILRAPVNLAELLEKKEKSCRYACSVEGKPFTDLLTICPLQNSITLLVGPEGDFSEREYDQIGKTNYQWARLSPTILRSEHAAFLAAGIIRSFIF